MKVIFLDIDGVLNSRQWFESTDYKEAKDYTSSCFSPVLVKRLNYLIEQTQANIVLSSSWRLGTKQEELEKLLSEQGVVGKLIDSTIDGRRSELLKDKDDIIRGDEIQIWLDTNKPDKYIILDDDSDMLNSQKENFIHCDFRIGLSMTGVNKGVSILNGVV